MDEQRIPALDVGRAVAIVGVVMAHLSFQFPRLPEWAAVSAHMGQYGVQLFFVISSMTIFMTLQADRDRYAQAKQVAARFYVKRFFRIAPLYYTAMLGYGVMSWYTLNFQPDHASVLGPHDEGDVLLNLVFLHAFSPSAINNVVPGGWSIGVEMLFYLLAPPISLFATTWRRLITLTLAILAGCATTIALFAVSGAPTTIEVQNNSFFYFWPPLQLPCFLLGMWAWFAFRRYFTGRRALGRCGSAVAVASLALCGIATATFGVWGGLAHACAPFAAACGAIALLLLCSSPAGHRAGVGPVRAIGRESYGIYLWHFIFAFLAMYLFKDSPLLNTHGGRMSMLAFALAVTGTVGASYAMSRLSERMIQQRASALARRVLSAVDSACAYRADGQRVGR
jgi:peptidoglycan/LPS O-acetylase OafA/YrhL